MLAREAACTVLLIQLLLVWTFFLLISRIAAIPPADSMLRATWQGLKRGVESSGESCLASTSRAVHSQTKFAASNSTKLTKQQAKNQRIENKELARRVREMTEPDPVLGHRKNEEGDQYWKSSELYKVLLSKDTVWGVREDRRGNLIPVEDEADAKQPKWGPTRVNFGLDDKNSRRMLFSDLAKVKLEDEMQRSTTFDSMNFDSMSDIHRAEEREKDSTTILSRILDLKNASGKGIQVENTRRIIQHFGARAGGGKGPDSGSVEVQTAILTYRIRNLHEHLESGHRHDNHNRRSMTLLVHQRARLLKYLKRTSPSRYQALLPRIGLQERAVEGEVVVPGKPPMQLTQ